MWSVCMCVLCVTDEMNVIILLCQNQPMGSYMFFCLQYVLISFEDVRFIWEPQGDIQCTYKCSGVRTHQISVQALIPLFVRFCVVTFGKLFCSEWIKNAKCVSVCLCRVSIPLLINHISDLSFDLFLSLLVLVLLFFLNTLICWHSVPLFFFSFLTEYCRRAGLPTRNPRQN